MNPRDPASARMVHESKGGGWAIIAFSPDKTTAYVPITIRCRMSISTGSILPAER
jgi:hypothetical protein